MWFQILKYLFSSRGEPATTASPGPGSTHARVGTAFNAPPPPPPQPPNAHWYNINMKEASVLTMNAIRDFIWPITAAMEWDYLFRRTDSFLYSTIGQLIWSSAGVLALMPVSAGVWSRVYGENYYECLKANFIASFSCLYAIIPWNTMEYLGADFFEGLGYSNKTAGYLASVFPGPGAAESTAQTAATAAMTCLLDSSYKLNEIAYAIDISPLGFLPGNLWNVVYEALSDIDHHDPAKMVGQLIALGLGVSLSVAIVNYFIAKTTVFLTNQIERHFNMTPSESPSRFTFFNRIPVPVTPPAPELYHAHRQ